MRVAVLGGGNGAFALAFHLSQMGHEVLMYAVEDFADDLKGIKDSGNKLSARQELNGSISEIYGEVTIAKTTTSAKEAAEFGKYLILICPAFGQGPTFQLLLPFLKKHHVFVSMPGSFALFEYARIIREYYELDSSVEEIQFPCVFAECSTIPYACRKLSPNEVFINGCKTAVEFGVYPSNLTNDIIKVLQTFFIAKILKVENIIEAGLYNLNIILHPPGVLFNSGWIERTGGDYLFYNDGFTPAICNAVKALDTERLEIGKKLNFNIEDHLTQWKKWYAKENKVDSPLHFLQDASVYNSVKAPKGLNNRYIIEDVQFSLIPLVECIAKPKQLKTPMADAIITSAKVLSGLPLKCERPLDKITLEYIMSH